MFYFAHKAQIAKLSITHAHIKFIALFSFLPSQFSRWYRGGDSGEYRQIVLIRAVVQKVTQVGLANAADWVNICCTAIILGVISSKCFINVAST